MSVALSLLASQVFEILMMAQVTERRLTGRGSGGGGRVAKYALLLSSSYSFVNARGRGRGGRHVRRARCKDRENYGKKDGVSEDPPRSSPNRTIVWEREPRKRLLSFPLLSCVTYYSANLPHARARRRPPLPLWTRTRKEAPVCLLSSLPKPTDFTLALSLSLSLPSLVLQSDRVSLCI